MIRHVSHLAVLGILLLFLDWSSKGHATVVFQADYNGPGGAEGGSSNIVTFGGVCSGLFSNSYQTVQFSGVKPLTSTSGNYLNVHWSQPTGGTFLTYTPDTASNSFASFVGPNITNSGHAYLNLNGGFDMFIRLNVADTNDYGSGAGISASWLGAENCNGNVVNGTSGLGISLTGLEYGSLRLLLIAGNPNAITNFTRIFGTAGSTSPSVGTTAIIYGDSVANMFAIPNVWHLGFTFSTDTNGLVTMKSFGVAGTGPIDTTSTGSELYGATFNVDAAEAGSNALSGSWYQSGYGSAGVDCDYDQMRLYNSPPASFNGLSTNSSTLPAPSVNIAPMQWIQRSDWINVMTDPSIAHHAVGDGINDDTQAIQDALNLASQVGLTLNNYPLTTNKTTVYLPPGTYKISSTLAWNTGGYGINGLALVGCGRDTTIAWYGTAGGTMFLSTGVNHSRYVGIRWDGRELASSGVVHQVQNVPNGGLPEDPVRHWNEAFLNFVGVGLNFANRSGNEWTGGCEVWNCLFYNCIYGSQIGLKYPNDYEYLFEGCEFEWCGTGIDSHGNVAQMTYDTHFEYSSVADMTSAAPVRVRHCTSTGSEAFITMPPYTGYGGQLHVIQDCWVDSWGNLGAGLNSGAITLGDDLLAMIFDCKFSNPPNNNPPINLNCYSGGTLTGAANLIVCNNSFPGISNQTNMVQISGKGLPFNVEAINVAPSNSNVGITTMLSSPNQIFLNSGPINDGPAVLDVTEPPYNAKRDASADATPAIQQAIDDAMAAHNGTIVYIPTGYFLIGSPLNIAGGNYSIQGSGYWTQLCWTGTNGGSVISVNTPTNIKLEQLMTKIPFLTAPQTAGITETSTGTAQLLIDNVLYFRYGPGGVNGSSPPAGFFPYRSNPYQNFISYTTGQGVVLTNLAGGSQVYLGYSEGPLTIHDCGSAEILGNHVTGGRVWVDGTTKPKTGFLGILYANMGIGYADQASNLYDLNIRDSQDYVNADYYDEQTLNNLDLEGGAANWTGRVTLQAFRQQNWSNSVAVTVKNYNGWCFYGPQAFANNVNGLGAPTNIFAPVMITQTGSNLFTLILPVDNFFESAPSINTDASCHLIETLDQTISSDYSTLRVLPDTPSPLTGADYTSISSGLDHLRQLGLEDLKLIRGVIPGGTATAPSITSGPGNVSTNIGSSASFNVDAVGTAPLNYQWYFDISTPVAGATNENLNVTNVQSSGTYEVLVSNPYGSVTSPAAKITVLPNPPASISAISEVNSVTLSFASVVNAKFYTIYRSKISGGPYAKIATTTSTKYADRNVIAGITYYYVVSSCDGFNLSTNSQQASANPQR